MSREAQILRRLCVAGFWGVTVLLLAGFAAFLFPERKEQVKQALARPLIKSEALPIGPAGKPESNIAIYILGGHRHSLERKFRVAAELYHQVGEGSRVLVLSKAGIMEYTASIKRNLAYDEWTTQALWVHGVRVEDIEPVRIEEGFFGTLSEAQAIPFLASRRGFSGLVLVTSPYHTRRTWETFQRFSRDLGLKLYVYPTDEKFYFRHILREYVKLLVYRAFFV